MPQTPAQSLSACFQSPRGIRIATLKEDLRSVFLPAVFLEFPIPVIQWAHLTGLQPARYAMEVERMLVTSHPISIRLGRIRRGTTHVTDTPSNSTLFGCRRALVCLAFDA